MSFNRVLFLRDAEAETAGAAPEIAKDYGYNGGESQEPEQVAPVVEVPKVEAAKVEVAKVEAPVAEVIEPAAPEVKTESVTAPDWKAALKTADKYEALKELGYADFDIDMLKYKEQTGNYDAYLAVKTVDYTKMTEEQVLKTSLKNQNPGLSEAAINFLYKEESKKYFLDREDYPEDSDEAKIGQEILRRDAETKRKQFIEEQNKFKAPERQPDLEEVQRQASLQLQREQIGKAVMNNDATVALKSSKAFQFGEGEDSFNYPISNVDDIVSTVMNTFLSSGVNDISNVDIKNFYRSLITASPGFLEAYGKHQRALEYKRLQLELGNITPQNSTAATPPPPTKNYGYGG